MGRQLHHWTKNVRQQFGAPTSGVSATGATTPGDDDFEAGHVQAWFTQLVRARQGIKQGTSSAGPRKPTVPPKPKITPSAKKKLKFTPPVVTKELTFSDTIGVERWDTPSERVENIKRAVKRTIRKKTTDAAKKKAASLAKKALDWKTWKTP